MNPVARFWNQPNPSVRNFQLVYTFLTLNFFFPALTYLFDPAQAIGQFEFLGSIFGQPTYDYKAQELGFVWRVLASGNVMTLAFMCFLLQWDVRKYYAVLVPLVFLKAYSSFAFLGVYVAAYRYHPFFLVFLYDGLTFAAMIYFAKKAKESLAATENR